MALSLERRNLFFSHQIAGNEHWEVVIGGRGWQDSIWRGKEGPGMILT